MSPANRGPGGRRSRDAGRPLGLSDALVLVAATAVGLAFARMVMAPGGYLTTTTTQGFGTPLDLLADMRKRGVFYAPFHVLYAPCVVAPSLLSWAVALAGLGLRRPSPSWRRLLRRPGFVACLAASVAVLFELAAWGMLGLPWLFGSQLVAESLYPRIYPLAFRALMQAMGRVGPAIAAAWVVQAMAGWRRPEPSWIDRAGRAVGWLLVLLFPLYVWEAFIVQ